MERLALRAAELRGGAGRVCDLEAALARGEGRLTLSCPPAAEGGAYRTLRAAADFLLDHPEAESLTLLCAPEDLAAYRVQWNMWFAERKDGAPTARENR